MKKQMIQAIAAAACGLALLTTSTAHAQGSGTREAQTLWQGGDVRIVNVTAGNANDVQNVVTLFNRPECATDNQGHYVIGQLQGQQLFTIVDVPPQNIQSNPGQNTTNFWGTIQQPGGPLN